VWFIKAMIINKIKRVVENFGWGWGAEIFSEKNAARSICLSRVRTKEESDQILQACI